MIRLASFNVNSIRRRVPHLRRFLDRHAPDLLFLQELKCQTAEFPLLELADSGYRVHAVGQTGGRNGVAVLGRIPFEVIAEALPGEDADSHARFVAVRAEGMEAAGIYLPNGNSGGEAGYQYKLRWMERLGGLDRRSARRLYPGGGAGRFQRLPHRGGSRPRRAAADRCAGAAGNPGALPGADPPRADRCAAGAAPDRTRPSPTGTTARPST